MKTKLLLLIALGFSCANSILFAETISENGNQSSDTLILDDKGQPITYMNEEGEIYRDASQLNESGTELQESMQSRAVSKKSAKGVSPYLIVNFKTKSTSENTIYINEITGQNSYTNGSYGVDGAYLGSIFIGDVEYVRFMQAGAIGKVKASEVQIMDYQNQSSVKACSYYAVRNGYLVHVIAGDIGGGSYANTLTIGVAPSYLSAGIPYYSYDGHYFYTSFEAMSDDYRNPNGINYSTSVNVSNPYFNYYQFLSHRSTTNIQSAQFDEYTRNAVGSSDISVSKMNNMGSYFTQYQNQYGVNALLMYAVAVNESYYGTSSIAMQKNNLFGHAAYDASAGSSASGYFSPDKSIYSHARYFISEGYLDPCDGVTSSNGFSSSCLVGRYYGGHLGDKASGVNVKYASDPYWGEKAANIAWAVSKQYTNANDNTKYAIGIKTSPSIDVKKSMSEQDTTLYNTGKAAYIPFTIKAKYTGWIQVQSDPVLSSDRSKMIQDNGIYDFNKDFGYIPAESVTIINDNLTPVPTPNIELSYQAHVQNVGWQTPQASGAVAGTVNQNLRIEAFKLQTVNAPVSGNINYQAHVQNIGWQTPVKNGEVAGTTGRSLQMEAMRISLDGELGNQYDIYYSTYVDSFGWLGWAKNGESAGTAGFMKKMQAIKIVLVKKGEAAPGSTTNAFLESGKTPSISYQTHVQNVGWMNYVGDAVTSGTVGQALRLEGIKINLNNPLANGSISYQTHVQNIGWQAPVSNNQLSGTTGMALRLEAIRISLTGELANQYDIYYRTHVQNFGWLGWAKNGEPSGTSNYAYRMEAIEIRLVNKNSGAITSAGSAFISK